MHAHSDPSQSPSPPIVLIHGLWMTPLSWEDWIDRYRTRGLEVHAPAWPGFDVGEDTLRANPKQIAGLDITTIIDSYEEKIRQLSEPPIIIGHSFGGLFAQLLLDRGLGVAGVALNPAHPRGAKWIPLSTLRATRSILGNPFSKNGATPLTEKQFHYAMTTTLSADESRKLWQRYAVPAANKVLWQGGFANFSPRAAARVDFKNPNRAPLLLVACSEDRIVTSGTVRSNYKLQSKSPSLTAFKEYEGRPHLYAGVAGWEEVADFALDWALAPRELT